MVKFKMPVDNYKITSRYSPSRLHPNLGIYRMHAGIDLINTKVGKAPIYATAAGKVRLVKTTKDGYGKYIIITHDIDGIKYESVYAHLDSFLVVQGDLVKQGDRIAYMGNTGTGTGVHLHFELHKGTYSYGNGTYPTSFDPEPHVTGKAAEVINTNSKEMKVSKVGLDLIKKFEGFYSEAYLDVVKVPTIGYGTTKWEDGKNVKLGEKITLVRAAALLERQVNEHASTIKKYIKVPLNQNQFDALASFQYNLGSGILAKYPKLAEYINTGQLKKATDLMLEFNKAGGKAFQGLVNRRKAEVELFNRPVEDKIKEDEDIMKFDESATKSIVREFLVQSINKGYFDKVHLERFDKGTLKIGDFEGLRLIAENKKK